MADTSRAGAMVASVQRAVRSLGVEGDDLLLLERAHRLAMEPRVALLDDDHHAAYLHPGRTILILVRDVGVTDVGVLAAAGLYESMDPGLRVDPVHVRETVGEVVVELLARVPDPASDRHVEELVTAPEAVQWIALAERLDHFRHLHMRGGAERWAALHEEGGSVWLPVAERVHPRLATRYRHWHRVFARRL